MGSAIQCTLHTALQAVVSMWIYGPFPIGFWGQVTSLSLDVLSRRDTHPVHPTTRPAVSATGFCVCFICRDGVISLIFLMHNVSPMCRSHSAILPTQ
ncbi:hypothetical protein FB45DRAFT_260130 [Roridomyces roridus]|uniref:Uncharacterized protein n=1 Tax=Roridomyces roridus TaxID=1738132 RepID=A0AAD7B9G5_9AGAR|nr:hypothetical protein FB45DRAFT_260130 [Roridomyces roridus]